MTINQYLGTVAWLWIASIMLLIYWHLNKPLHQQKRLKRYWLFSVAMFFLPSILFETLFKRERLSRMWATTFLIWLACPIYLLVSASFAFSITYIGG